MSRPAARFGWLLFVCSLLVAAGCTSLVLFVHDDSRPLLLLWVRWVGLGCSILSFFAGHFSYPRVHNLKVYLLGYLTGITGAAFFLLMESPFPVPLAPPPYAYSSSLHLLVFLNIIIVLVVPSFVTYRLTRHITLTIGALEALAIISARLAPEVMAWATPLAFQSFLSWPAWIGPLWFAGVLTLSVRKLKEEFHFGGLLAGTALLYLIPWIAGPAIAEPVLLRTCIFAAAPLFLCAGMVVHWFSRMEHRISYDPLLHIYNRNYCTKIIEEQSKINSVPPFGVAMVDIDHFKKVNDTHGHHAGDVVLHATAQTVSRNVVPDGIACRYGGEELAVFFPGKTSKEVSSVMERVRQEVEKTKISVGKKSIQVTISCGVSHREDSLQSIMDVINAADKALYKAKEGGRNQVRSGKTALIDKRRSRAIPIAKK